MDGENSQFEFLDALTIVSFMLQVANQAKIFGINDVQKELGIAMGEVHAHLEKQDEKINKILEILQNEDNKKTFGNDRG